MVNTGDVASVTPGCAAIRARTPGECTVTPYAPEVGRPPGVGGPASRVDGAQPFAASAPTPRQRCRDPCFPAGLQERQRGCHRQETRSSIRPCHLRPCSMMKPSSTGPAPPQPGPSCPDGDAAQYQPDLFAERGRVEPEKLQFGMRSAKGRIPAWRHGSCMTVFGEPGTVHLLRGQVPEASPKPILQALEREIVQELPSPEEPSVHGCKPRFATRLVPVPCNRRDLTPHGVPRRRAKRRATRWRSPAVVRARWCQTGAAVRAGRLEWRLPGQGRSVRS